MGGAIALMPLLLELLLQCLVARKQLPDQRLCLVPTEVIGVQVKGGSRLARHAGLITSFQPCLNHDVACASRVRNGPWRCTQMPKTVARSGQ